MEVSRGERRGASEKRGVGREERRGGREDKGVARQESRGGREEKRVARQKKRVSRLKKRVSRLKKRVSSCKKLINVNLSPTDSDGELVPTEDVEEAKTLVPNEPHDDVDPDPIEDIECRRG